MKEDTFVPKLCDDCTFGKRLYADGHIRKDWSGYFEGDPSALPPPTRDADHWTYLECAKNNKGLKHVNLDGRCCAYQIKRK